MISQFVTSFWQNEAKFFSFNNDVSDENGGATRVSEKPRTTDCRRAVGLRN
jgi:hypothetical protein